MRDINEILAKKTVALQPSGIRKFFDIVRTMEGAISLGVGEPDFDTPWPIREEGIYSLERGRTFYTSNAGLNELREEIARYIQRRFGVSYEPLSEITVTVGGSEGIDLACRAVLGPRGAGCAWRARIPRPRPWTPLRSCPVRMGRWRAAMTVRMRLC